MATANSGTQQFITWVNDGAELPPWLRSGLIEDRAPNGTMMIKTPLGAARVHVDDVVIRHGNALWSRPRGELHDFLNALKAEVIPGPSAIGVGKVTRLRPKSGKRKPERQHHYPPPRGTMPSIEWVHVSQLSVDTTYQRSIDNAVSQKLIGSIAQNFDWRLCAPLVVSRRPDGSKVVIDGQHRWAAAIRRGDLLQLPCCLFTYDSPEEEARMFITANRARKQMNRLDDFHAAIVAGDEDSVEIKRLVEEAGLKIARNPHVTRWMPGQVAFVSSLSNVLRRYGPAIVSAALTNLAEAFGDQRLLYGTSLFLAMAEIFAKPPEGFDPDDVVPALRLRTMEEWGAPIKGLKGNDARCAVMRAELLALLEVVDPQSEAA